MSKNFATSLLTNTPGPGGTSATVTTGTGSRFIVGKAAWGPATGDWTPDNAEIISITDVSSDTLTVARAAESSTAVNAVTGYKIVQGVTAAMWDGLVTGVSSVVGSTGAVTGAQIVADATVQAAIGASTKRVTDAISGTNSSFSSGFERCARFVRTLPVATTRWRLKISNCNDLAGSAAGGSATANGVWVGTPSNLANFTAAPTSALGSFSVAADGTDFVSAWVTDPALQWSAGERKMLSIGYTMTGSIACDLGRGWAFSTVAADASAQNLSTNGYTNGAFPFDTRIEYETVTNRAVGVVLGTSLCQGFQSVNTGTSVDTPWPQQMANITGRSLVTNAAIGSSTLSTFGTSNRAWTRLDLTTTVPDFAVLEFSNDVMVGSNSLATIQTSVTNMVTQCKNAGIRRVWLVMPAPRPGTIGSVVGTLQAGTSVGATSISTDFNPGNVLISIGTGLDYETVTVSGNSGTGPYTLTVPALTKAHTAGAYVRSGREQVRQDVINWLRTTDPASLGIAGTLDWDVALVTATTPGGWEMDARFKGSDGIHFQVATHSVLARLLAG